MRGASGGNLSHRNQTFYKSEGNARVTVAHCLSLRRIHSEDSTSFLH